jgi:histidyl-tRNA synthetase
MAVHLAKGTRDALPEDMSKRLAVISELRGVFTNFGFSPLDTPAFERIETLTGKYGEEGAKLIFKILKRGAGGERGECDLALRYDLTVPLARVMAMNSQIRLPFKRYQIAPVWRADRPAKGRFREFVQCDVDIVGAPGILADAECLAVLCAGMDALGLAGRYTVRLNDRRILHAIARAVGAEDEVALLVAVDKLDKIGREGVTRQLASQGIGAAQIDTLWQLLSVGSDNSQTLANLREALPESDVAVEALSGVLQAASDLGADIARIRVDPSLARGLDYYTGPVFEVVSDELAIGSLAGGGRYDELIGMFSGRDIPAVGLAFGLDRIVMVLEQLGRLPETDATQVFVTVYDPESYVVSCRVARELREAGVRTELYLGQAKLAKQFKLANARKYPWLVVIGPSEIEAGGIALKNMRTGEQRSCTPTEAAAIVSA